MKQEMLSSSSSPSSGDENDDEHQFTINEHFARAYEYRKEREELSKLKDKYGSDGEGDEDEETDSEEDETEDEDGEELTPAVDAAILRTLARIKKRDPGIYEAGRNVYDEEHQKLGKPSLPAPKPKEKVSKPVLLHQQRLAAELDAHSRSPSPTPEPTYTEAQAHLRAETIAAFHEPDADDELFTLREKTQDELAREEEEYRRYLEREVGGLEGLVEVEPAEVKVEVKEGEAGTKEKKKKKGKEKKGETEEVKQSDQEFLMNYILNRGWIDRSSKRVPTFDEVTRGPAPHASKPDAAAPGPGPEPDVLHDEDEFDDVADAFESSYNFRFEEPDAPHIPSFPRAVPSVRRPAAHAERRKEARERRKERKEEEVRLRREEVGRLKGLKMREMQAKLERVAKEGGWRATKALETLDVEGDWDPAAYDAQMAAILKEVEGDAEAEADEKPMWDDDIDIGDIHVSDDDEAGPSTSSKKKEKKKEKKKAKKEHEPEGVDVDAMDADVTGDAWDEEEWDGTEEMRKRVLDKYMDELYGLEFNDMVGDLPTRFHYTPVAKETFALTPAEVLLATDKELNEYVGLRQYAPYREKARWDAKRGERLREFKQKVGTRAQELGAELEEKQERGTKKRKGKKERMKERASKVGLEEDVDVEMADGAKEAKKAVVPEETKDGAKKKRRALEEDAAQDDVQTNGGDAEPSKKKRRRHKKSGKGHDIEAES